MPPRDPTIPADMKRCPRCGEVKPRTEFYTRGPGRLYARCKSCVSAQYRADPEPAKARAAKRYREKREDCLEANRAWRQTNSERKRENDRRWREENPERRLEHSRQWRERNHDRHLELNAKSRRAHPETGRKVDHRRRAFRLGAAVVEDVDLQVLFERDGGICQLCLEPVDPELRHPDLMCASTDHIIPLSKGGDHSYANTQLAHLICNIRKNDRVEEVMPLAIPDEGVA